VFLIIKSGFRCSCDWSAQPSNLTMVTIISNDFLKTNPGVKDLPQPGMEPLPPSPQSDAITSRPWRPHLNSYYLFKKVLKAKNNQHFLNFFDYNIRCVVSSYCFTLPNELYSYVCCSICGDRKVQ